MTKQGLTQYARNCRHAVVQRGEEETMLPQILLLRRLSEVPSCQLRCVLQVPHGAGASLACVDRHGFDLDFILFTAFLKIT